MMELPNPKEQGVHLVLLPFVASKGTTIVQNLNKTPKNVLPNNVKLSYITMHSSKNHVLEIRLKIEETKNINSDLFIM